MYNKIAPIYNEFGWNNFSKKLLMNLRLYLKKWKAETHLDLACGTGDFVFGMNRFGIKSFGIDKSKSMVSVAKKNYPKLEFKLGDMTKFSLKKPVDFITCNYDSINHLLLFKEWKKVFVLTYNNLKPKGKFLFDFNTLYNINNNEKIKYVSLSDRVLIIKTEKLNKNKMRFNIEYFIKSKKSYLRYNYSALEVSFPLKKIRQVLLNIGFNKCRVLFSSKRNYEKQNRIIILAEK